MGGVFWLDIVVLVENFSNSMDVFSLFFFYWIFFPDIGWCNIFFFYKLYHVFYFFHTTRVLEIDLKLNSYIYIYIYKINLLKYTVLLIVVFMLLHIISFQSHYLIVIVWKHCSSFLSISENLYIYIYIYIYIYVYKL